MTRLEQIEALNEMLLEEMPNYRAESARLPREEAAQRRLLRSLMNVRPPMPLSPEYLAAQDALLAAEREKNKQKIDFCPDLLLLPSLDTVVRPAHSRSRERERERDRNFWFKR